MSEDPTPLAQRLVDAASGAICTVVCGGVAREDLACSPDDWTRESDAAVVAVLRELADHIRAFPLMELDEPGPTFDGGMWNAYAQLSNTFAFTADSIEKGEG